MVPPAGRGLGRGARRGRAGAAAGPRARASTWPGTTGGLIAGYLADRDAASRRRAVRPGELDLVTAFADIAELSVGAAGL